MQSADRTVVIGQRAAELMRAYSRCASPRCYEVWYIYVTGLKPELNAAVKRLIGQHEMLSPEDIDDVYEQFVGPDRALSEADRTGTSLLLEMEQVLGLIEVAIGSTAEYGASLQEITGDLSGTMERTRLRDVVEALVGATRQVAASNTVLETRLRESRTEIQQLHAVLEEVRLEGLTDALTGLSNRKQFETTLASSVAWAQAEGARLTLIVIDIDLFKRFNDTYGHLTGDQVLRLVSAAMRENVDSRSTLARFGGEEFTILMPDTGPDEAQLRAEKIRRNVMGRELVKRSTGESLGRVTISLGIATLRPDDTVVSFVERADHCMYRAKETGRNRIVTDQAVGSGIADAA